MAAVELMSLIEKMPLINNPNKAVRIGGYFLYGMLALMVLAALSPHEEQIDDEPVLDTSSAGQTGHIEYGDVAFDLPAGFYLVHKLGNNSARAIQARKDGPGEEKWQSLAILWGLWIAPAPESESLQTRIERAETTNYPTKGRYTKIASGQTAWILDPTGEYEGRHLAYVDYKDMTVTQVPGTEGSLPEEGMTVNEFEDFVKSINIKG